MPATDLQTMSASDAAKHVSEKYASFQEFLDKEQYSKESVLGYEKIFGRTFVSTGGRETTQTFLPQLCLQAGQKVLDVGCGIGGSAFMMASEYGAEVVGFDLSENMISIAHDRLAEVKVDKVSFEIADATLIDYPEESFDVIYSRDTILHIKDKTALFTKFFKWLKPGGRLFITDYCCSLKPWTPEYEKYVQGRGYYLLTVDEYTQILKTSGFVNTVGKDLTSYFLEILNKEVVKIQSLKEEFLKENIGEARFQYIVTGWENKIQRSTHGNQRWGSFFATKSS